jgi:hypothetical protein
MVDSLPAMNYRQLETWSNFEERRDKALRIVESSGGSYTTCAADRPRLAAL